MVQRINAAARLFPKTKRPVGFGRQHKRPKCISQIDMCGIVLGIGLSLRRETGCLFPRGQLKTRRLAAHVIHADARQDEANLGTTLGYNKWENGRRVQGGAQDTRLPQGRGNSVNSRPNAPRPAIGITLHIIISHKLTKLGGTTGSQSSSGMWYAPKVPKPRAARSRSVRINTGTGEVVRCSMESQISSRNSPNAESHTAIAHRNRQSSTVEKRREINKWRRRRRSC